MCLSHACISLAVVAVYTLCSSQSVLSLSIANGPIMRSKLIPLRPFALTTIHTLVVTSPSHP